MNKVIPKIKETEEEIREMLKSEHQVKRQNRAIEEIKEILGTTKGFRRYKEIHQLIVNKYEIEMGYANVHQVVRYKLDII